jgi:hypothetical protein
MAHSIIWEGNGPEDDPRAALYGRVVGGYRGFGVPLHIEALRVRVNEDGVQEPDTDDPTLLAQWDALLAFTSPDAPFETFEDDGERFVLVLTPYCR